MAEPTLYLFDGWNLLHAGDWRRPEELIDALASFVALRGARGVLVFDGVGRDETIGPLRVRFAADADAVLERLAAEHRDRETVAVVSSDFAIRGTTGQECGRRARASSSPSSSRSRVRASRGRSSPTASTPPCASASNGCGAASSPPKRVCASHSVRVRANTRSYYLGSRASGLVISWTGC